MPVQKSESSITQNTRRTFNEIFYYTAVSNNAAHTHCVCVCVCVCEKPALIHIQL